MEFALLIWAIGMLPKLGLFLGLTLAALVAYILIYYVVWFLEDGIEKPSHRTGAMLTAMFISILLVLTPSTKTAYMMVGAYATQKMVEAPETKQITGKIITIINDKLDQEMQRK